MLLAALLALLTAAPAAAQAQKPADCLTGAAASFDAFRTCQSRARAALVDAADKKGAPLTGAQLDAVDDAQRAEARAYLSRPSVVVSGPAADKLPAAATPGKLGGLKPGAAAGLQSSPAILALQDRLQAAAGDGRAGITASMADDVRATLLQAQGGLSPEMRDLLDSVARDGAKLTPDTMTKLQGAGRAAKASGLELGIDPKIEKSLLDDDFGADKAAFDAAQPPGAL